MKLIVVSIYDGYITLSCIENGIEKNAPKDLEDWCEQVDNEKCGFYFYNVIGDVGTTGIELIKRIHELDYDALICENGCIEYIRKGNK